MGGYTKNIAVIRELKNGFSVDGGALSGIVKAERYGANLKIEVSLINFAPLTQGKYVCGITDGKAVCVLDGLSFEGISAVDTGAGFAAIVCFVDEAVSPIAGAVCGRVDDGVSLIKKQIEKQENLKKEELSQEYEDEAIAQDNYYEYGQAHKNSGTVCENSQKEGNGQNSGQNETTARAFKKDGLGRLSSDGNFYSRMKEEIEKVLSSYPAEEGLESTVEQSRWVKISYGDNKHYVFGVIYGGGEAQYICYGVPSQNPEIPPTSFENSSFIPAKSQNCEGYWVMYQDAKTGASVKLKAC